MLEQSAATGALPRPLILKTLPIDRISSRYSSIYMTRATPNVPARGSKMTRNTVLSQQEAGPNRLLSETELSPTQDLACRHRTSLQKPSSSFK